jgi:hypothetical protein
MAATISHWQHDHWRQQQQQQQQRWKGYCQTSSSRRSVQCMMQVDAADTAGLDSPFHLPTKLQGLTLRFIGISRQAGLTSLVRINHMQDARFAHP